MNITLKLCSPDYWSLFSLDTKLYSIYSPKYFWILYICPRPKQQDVDPKYSYVEMPGWVAPTWFPTVHEHGIIGYKERGILYSVSSIGLNLNLTISDSSLIVILTASTLKQLYVTYHQYHLFITNEYTVRFWETFGEEKIYLSPDSWVWLSFLIKSMQRELTRKLHK